MQKYRKKPVEIEAVQFLGTRESARQCLEFMGEFDGCLVNRVGFRKIAKNYEPFIEIKTLEGVLTASKGDWIIKGIQGEYYPCKPDIFQKTYDLVSEDNGK